MLNRSGVALILFAFYLPAPAALAGPALERGAWGPVSQSSGSQLLDVRYDTANSRGRTAQAEEPIPPLPVRKTSKGKPTEAPPPDVWQPSEIAAAKARCAELLSGIDAVVEPQPPIKEGQCGTPAPIRLISLGKGRKVTFSPPALVNCQLAAALHTWINKDLQRWSMRHLGKRIAQVEVMSDYSCRTAFGRVGNRLSQHAYADALDIRGFVLETGERVEVLDGWGMTERDIAAQAAAAKAKAEAQAKTNVPDTDTRKVAKDPDTRKATKAALELAAAKLGGPDRRRDDPAKDDATKVAALGPEPPPVPVTTRQSQFLRAAHASACRIFGTTLGPEANDAHRNHFHVDMAERKVRKICD